MCMNQRVELLAPAGNYEAFIGAINAGADAVYLGGEKFGARAYADNFSTEEICNALHIAHFMGRKIYLTVNTLMKESELEELYDYLLPLYEAGLDGVIVQDMGVFCYIRDHFKNLALHASTQMTLTGVRGASFLKSRAQYVLYRQESYPWLKYERSKSRPAWKLNALSTGQCVIAIQGNVFSAVF